MIPLTQMQGADKCLPKKIEMNFYGESTLPHNHTSEEVGHNTAVSQVEKVGVVVDVEKLSKIIQSIDDAYLDGEMGFEMSLNTEESIKMAQALSDSSSEWLKLVRVK